MEGWSPATPPHLQQYGKTQHCQGLQCSTTFLTVQIQKVTLVWVMFLAQFLAHKK